MSGVLQILQRCPNEHQCRVVSTPAGEETQSTMVRKDEKSSPFDHAMIQFPSTSCLGVRSQLVFNNRRFESLKRSQNEYQNRVLSRIRARKAQSTVVRKDETSSKFACQQRALSPFSGPTFAPYADPLCSQSASPSVSAEPSSSPTSSPSTQAALFVAIKQA
jgi:hypothetical protein